MSDDSARAPFGTHSDLELGAQPLGLLGRFLNSALSGLATLPKRAMEASETFRTTGEYDAAPMVEAALMTMGGTSLGAPAGSMGAGPVRRGALDMSQEARLARAQAEGFDTATPVYHGTSKDAEFKKFKDSRHGTWTTRDPKEASSYATQNDSMGHSYEGGRFIPTNTASRVMPMYAKPLENPYVVDKVPDAVRNASNYKKAQSEWFDSLRRAGHDGVDYGSGVRVDFRNENLRSAFAPFDPKNTDKSVILGAGPTNPLAAVPTAAASDKQRDRSLNYFFGG